MSEPEQPPTTGLILYQSEDGQTRVQCRFEDESIWLTQRLMAELFQVGVNTINHHIKGIYADGELPPEATIRRYRIVQIEGERQIARLVEHYNLSAILAVGYRVRSPRGTQFRQWATDRLSEYLVKGFVLDEPRLKNPLRLGPLTRQRVGATGSAVDEGGDGPALVPQVQHVAQGEELGRRGAVVAATAHEEPHGLAPSPSTGCALRRSSTSHRASSAYTSG